MADSYNAFLSYARADTDQVRRLAENLHQNGIDVFFDEWEIAPGDVLVHQLDRGILDSRNGILAVTPTALSRPWVQAEYAAMMSRVVEGKQRLIPVLLADAEMPPLLASQVWVDLRNADGPEYEREMGKLLAILRGERPGPPPRILPRPDTAFRPEGPLIRRLRIGREKVSLLNEDEVEAEHSPRGLSFGTEHRIWELDRLRHGHTGEGAPYRASSGAAAPVRESTQNALLLEIGALLGREFFDGSAGEALQKAVQDAERQGAPLELALEVADDLADLPWETLRLSGPGGIPSDPLALHPNVRLFRAVTGLGPTPAMSIPGPLRILVAIGSPEEGGELLDMERELSRILDAVEPARKQRRPAYVRVLERGTVATLREALEAERYHVLHVTCHAGPGVLILEKEDGSKDEVRADRFCQEALVPGRGVPVVVLAGCATALGTRGDGKQGEAALPGLARQLLARGVPAVMAMQAPVTDPYATELGARFYRALAIAERPDPLAALAEARRSLENDRRDGRVTAPVDLAEWATSALYLRGPSLPLYDPEAPFEIIEPPPEPRFAEGVVVRPVGEFVGRRREERKILQALRGSDGAGVLLRGLGGVGKSSLAAETQRQLLEDGWLVASVYGETSPDGFLAEVGRRYLAAFQQAGMSEADPRRQLAAALGRPGLDWEERFEHLSRHLLGERRLIVLLDNFEDNLRIDATDLEPELKNEDLADLLARWLRNPGLSRFLITSRHPFQLPKRTHRRLDVLHLGPLSFAETRKLVWRLPGLDALARNEQLRAYRDVGGHPRALEYLDALLRGGQARFRDVAERMEEALEKKGIRHPESWMQQAEGDLDRALAETVTLAVDDVLLDRLLERLEGVPLAKEVLVGASVYRVPVDELGLQWQVAEETAIPGDRERGERIRKLDREITRVTDRGERPAPELIEEVRTEWKEWCQPPIRVPEAFGAAGTVLATLGLLTPLALNPADPLYIVHRWTASAITGHYPGETIQLAHHRAAQYWRWRVERLFPNQPTNLRDLQEARHHHFEAKEVEEASDVTEQLCFRLKRMGAYRWEEQLWKEMLGWFPPSSAHAAAFMHNIGTTFYSRGGLDEAESWYFKSLELKEKLGGSSRLASTYFQLGRVAQDRGLYDQSVQWYRKALSIYEKHSQLEGVAQTLHQLGWIAQDKGDYEAALDFYGKAIELSDRTGNREGVANGFHHRGLVAHLRGNYAEAETWYRKSLQIRSNLGDRPATARGLNQLGRLAEDRGDFEQALSWLRQSLEMKEDLGDWIGMAHTYNSIANVASRRGDHELAETCINKALQIFEVSGIQRGLSGMYHQLGILAQGRADYDKARVLYTKSYQISEELENRSGMAASLHQMGLLEQDLGCLDQALDFYHRAVSINQEIGHEEGLAINFNQIGAIFDQRSDPSRAAEWYRKSLEISQRLGMRFEAAHTMSRLGILLTKQGSVQEGFTWNLRSLSVRMKMQTPDLNNNLIWLRRQRGLLGEDSFREQLQQNLGEEAARAVLRLID